MSAASVQTSGFDRRPAFPLLYLAPMAGITNSIFRRICKSRGADVLTTEFVSADGVLHRNERTGRYLAFTPEERPLGVQLFGADPIHLARGAMAVAEWVNPDFIDINFGCPVNKVVCKNGGSALLRTPETLSSVASAIVRAVAPLPVTAKIRIGWTPDSINATENSLRLQDAGIRRITIHGRTRSQGYSGEADWDVIATAADAVEIPVIGNGDITTAEIAVKRWKESPVSGLMIGRAAMTSPWIFQEIRAAFLGHGAPPPPTLADRWDLIEEHCHAEIANWRDPVKGMHSLRARLMAYSRGLPESRELRRRISGVESLDHLTQIRTWHQSCAPSQES